MQLVGRLRRGFLTVLVLAALAAVCLFIVGDPSSLAIAVPLALAFGLLLTGRRLQSLRLIAVADVLAIGAVALIAYIHLR